MVYFPGVSKGCPWKVEVAIEVRRWKVFCRVAEAGTATRRLSATRAAEQTEAGSGMKKERRDDLESPVAAEDRSETFARGG